MTGDGEVGLRSPPGERLYRPSTGAGTPPTARCSRSSPMSTPTRRSTGLPTGGHARGEQPQSLHRRVDARAILAHLGSLEAGSVVVDLGCSTGYLLEEVRAGYPGATLVGIDLVGAGLRKAHVNVPDARLVQADALPLADSSVDAAVSANLLEHVPDDQRALAELCRVLRPGAPAVLVVPAGARVFDYYDRFLGHERRYARRAHGQGATGWSGGAGEHVSRHLALSGLLAGQAAQSAPLRPPAWRRTGKARGRRHRPYARLPRGPVACRLEEALLRTWGATPIRHPRVARRPAAAVESMTEPPSLPGPPGQKHRSISVVVPAYNEEANIEPAYARLSDVLDGLDLDWELIFSVDPSVDRTEELILALRQDDPRVKMLRFSRRFGQPMATLAGMQAATGDAVVVIDCDLQDPPELIPELVGRWRRATTSSMPSAARGPARPSPSASCRRSGIA